LQQQMKMVGDQRPGKTTGRSFGKNSSQSGNEIVAIEVIPENLPAFKTAANNMMKRAGGVYAGLSGHEVDCAPMESTHNRMGVPLLGTVPLFFPYKC